MYKRYVLWKLYTKRIILAQYFVENFIVCDCQFSLMLIPCIIRRIRTDQQYALIVPLLCSMYWLLHVSAVACHHQGAY
jgi:hypothetical protein